MSKYRAKPVTIDGFRFASTREGNRYLELRMLQRAGKITELELQPAFELLPGFKRGKAKIRPIKYVADFKYRELPKRNLVIEDLKGVATPLFRLKQKWFWHKYPDLELRITR